MAHGGRQTRRALITGLTSAVAFGSLAGCLEGRDEVVQVDGTTAPATGGTTDRQGADATGTTDTGSTGQTSTSAEQRLDLREANVVDVAVASADGRYTFDVTLHHDDDGEDGYANWWQVERLDGTQLGRRDLLHAHSRQPFTRSETVDVPADVTCVVVRGHGETHGYGGQSMTVDVESGAVRAIDQGPEPRPVDESDCP